MSTFSPRALMTLPSPRALMALGLSVAVASAGALAAAQQLCEDGRVAIGQTTRAVEKLDRELACLREKRERLARVLALLGQAEAQAHNTSLSAREREDGETAVVSLRRQAADIERESQRCVETAMVFAVNETAQPVNRVVAPAADPAADHVAQPNDSTRVVERDTRLTDDVRVVVGEQVDGLGRWNVASVRSGLHGIGGRLGACYDHMLEHGALREGTMILVFTVGDGGRVSRVGVEDDHLDDASLRRCVRQAGESLHFDASGRAAAGTATYSYTLRFGR